MARICACRHDEAGHDTLAGCRSEVVVITPGDCRPTLTIPCPCERFYHWYYQLAEDGNR